MHNVPPNTSTNTSISSSNPPAPGETGRGPQPKAPERPPIPADVISKPDDLSEDRWTGPLRLCDETILSSLPRIARRPAKLRWDACRQAVIQLLPPLPESDDQDPAVRKSVMHLRRKATPGPEVVTWLRSIEDRATEGRKGTAWLTAVLKSGPDPATYLAPGFGVDAQLNPKREGSHA